MHRTSLPLCLLVLGCGVPQPPGSPSARGKAEGDESTGAPCGASIGGWDHVVRRVHAGDWPQGYGRRPRWPSKERVCEVLGAIEPFDTFDFGLFWPTEAPDSYRRFFASRAATDARSCHEKHREKLLAAQEALGVSSAVVAAIMFVESECGDNTGDYRVMHRVARWAMADAPSIVEAMKPRYFDEEDEKMPPEFVRGLDGEQGALEEMLDAFRDSIARLPEGQAQQREELEQLLKTLEDALDETELSKDLPSLVELVDALTRARADYLANRGYANTVAAIVVAERLEYDLEEWRGSSTGSFGWVQFMPISFLRYGVDGDSDGRVDLFGAADAISSCANYLAKHGWTEDLAPGDPEARVVLHAYNPSAPYAEAVLHLARKIEESL